MDKVCLSILSISGGKGFDSKHDFAPPTDGLEEAQAGIKIAGRNINNLRYAVDTTLIAESEEEQVKKN